MKAFAAFGWALLLTQAVTIPTSRSVETGQKSNWKAELEVTLFGESTVFSSEVEQEVLSATGEGYTIRLTPKSTRLTVAGEEVGQDSEGAKPTETRYAPNGDVIEVKGTEASGWRLASMRSVRLPAEPQSVGQSWTRAIPGDASQGRPPAQGSYTFESLETSDAVVLAKIAVDFKETEGERPLTAKGTAWIDPKDGATVKLELTFENAPIGGAPEPLSGKLKMVRSS